MPSPRLIIRRIAAASIDLVLLGCLLGIPLLVMLGNSFGNKPQDAWPYLLLVGSAVAWMVLEAVLPQTAGKRAFDLVVVQVNGRRASLSVCGARVLVKYLPLLLIVLAGSLSDCAIFGPLSIDDRLGEVFVELFGYVGLPVCVVSIGMAFLGTGRTLHDVLSGTMLSLPPSGSEPRGFPIEVTSPHQVGERVVGDECGRAKNAVDKG